jgi:hypothetical protein
VSAPSFALRVLRYQCPDCARKFAPVLGMMTATQVIRRTCAGCRTRWQIVITPHQKPIGYIDVGTFSKLPEVAL